MALAVADGKTRDDHVRVTDGLDLVDVVRVDAVVERRVQIVEEVDDLEGGRLARNHRETDNVAEEDGHHLEALGADLLAGLEALRDRPRQHAVQQLVRLALLVGKLFRALLDEAFQVVRVRLEHLGHRVHDVHAGIGVDLANAARNVGKRGALLRIGVDALLDELRKLLRNFVVVGEGRAEALLADLVHNVLGIQLQAVKGQLARHELGENHAIAVHVALLRAVGQRLLAGLENLGGGPEQAAVARRRRLVLVAAQLLGNPAEAKVGDLADPARVHDEVGGREAAVAGEGRRVEVLHALGGVRGKRVAEHPVELVVGVREHVLERAARGILKDEDAVRGVKAGADEAVDVCVAAVEHAHEARALGIADEVLVGGWQGTHGDEVALVHRNLGAPCTLR
eukprot:Opistho-1_new@56664